MEFDFREAIELMKAGNEVGFNKLYSATYNKVYFRAKECTKTEEDAMDVTQITFIEAYKNIDKLQAPEATLTWLYTICYNQACKMYRGEREKREYLLSEESEGAFDMMETADISTMPELSADQKATAEIIKGIIEELPELQKMTVLAFYFDNLKLEQISEMMDCSVNTVKSRLNYARKFIKEKVEEKEKKEGYKLHVFAIPTLFFAIRLLAQETVMEKSAATMVYANCCGELGLVPGVLGFKDVGKTIKTTAKESIVQVSSTTTAKTAGIFAGKTATVAAGKLGAIIGAVVIGGGAIAGGFALSRGNNQFAPTVVATSIEDSSGHVEEKESFSISDDLKGMIGEWTAQDGGHLWITSPYGEYDGGNPTVEFVKERDIAWTDLEVKDYAEGVVTFAYNGGGTILVEFTSATDMVIHYNMDSGYKADISYKLTKPGYEYYENLY